MSRRQASEKRALGSCTAERLRSKKRREAGRDEQLAVEEQEMSARARELDAFCAPALISVARHIVYFAAEPLANLLHSNMVSHSCLSMLYRSAQLIFERQRRPLRC